MKKVISFIITFAVTLTVSAQNWTKEMQKDFRKSKDVAIVADLSKATIMGVSYDKFPIYYAGKYHTDKEYASIVLEKIVNEVKTAFRAKRKLPIVDESNAKYVVHYDFYEITEEAAFNGVFYVMYGNNKSAEINFKWKKGKWNDFEALMEENIRKLFKYAIQDPYYIDVYKYKKDSDKNNWFQ